MAFYGVKFLPQDPLRLGIQIPVPEHKLYTSRGVSSLKACALIFTRGHTMAVCRAKKGNAPIMCFY